MWVKVYGCGGRCVKLGGVVLEEGFELVLRFGGFGVGFGL